MWLTLGGGFGWLTGRLRLSWTQRSVRIELEDLRDEAQWECPTAGVAFQPTVDLGQRPSVKGTEPPNAYFQLLVGPSLDCRRARGVDDLIELGTRVRQGWGSVATACWRNRVAAVPQGEASAAADRLLRNLSGAGIFVVDVGELERWVPDIGGHGPSWCTAVLAAGRHEDPALAARDFVERVASSVGLVGQIAKS